MKKILFLLLIPFSISAQVVSADFVVINEGMDSSYHDLEKIWSVYHMESIKRSIKPLIKTSKKKLEITHFN